LSIAKHGNKNASKQLQGHPHLKYQTLPQTHVFQLSRYLALKLRHIHAVEFSKILSWALGEKIFLSLSDESQI
jgi:hypothetical protein